jgi:hypothetical protein
MTCSDSELILDIEFSWTRHDYMDGDSVYRKPFTIKKL